MLGPAEKKIYGFNMCESNNSFNTKAWSFSCNMTWSLFAVEGRRVERLRNSSQKCCKSNIVQSCIWTRVNIGSSNIETTPTVM